MADHLYCPDHDQPLGWCTHYKRSLLGRPVRVTINTSSGGEATVAAGKLLGFGQGGDFEILEEDGMVHYCWPMLSIEEAGDGG